MDDASSHTILTEQEAAALLQPYTPNKSAVDWLAHDRQRDPVIPFILLGKTPYYRERDLIFFITRMLDSKVRFVRINHLLYLDHRNVSERRRTSERRKREAIHLRQGIERRRWTDLDRRLGGGMNRRSHPAMI
ncbi:hypothetical protein [Sulfuriferula multivorans]|uniref:hypothetical protein n=1 Tax=Sulfuriferula multivorans TaxID=1559896 RepID=UPI000F5C0D71|nr:hypothetical protein [Sulfuriferula multivorans]